ncbi:MAG: metallophosphoesterase [Bacteroidales bacterium]|nr:metallophosphoesterase [Bacteroidales bacterium]
MKLVKLSFLLFFLFCMIKPVAGIIPERTGFWKFDNPADLTAAETGMGFPLELIGTANFAAGPADGNGAVLTGPGSYFKVRHALPVKDGENFVNEYSLQFDFMVSQLGIWHSFFQTSVMNNNDGDFFINPSGNIGVAAVGYSNYTVVPGEWYRLVISVKNGTQFKCYLDGNLLLSGVTQAIDGRFSLDSLLLIFADENGEDGSIYCSEFSIWDKALDFEQIKELDGYGHFVSSYLMTRIPFLQGPGVNSMNICWHDTAAANTRVNYGLDSTLGNIAEGSSELISFPYRWHSVKLSSLQPDTRYFYNVSSGDSSSAIYSFRTLPDNSFKGKIRFLMFSDTHSSDSSSAAKVLRAAKTKISELYGDNPGNDINCIFHSGDLVVSGNSPEQYSMQFFRPFSVLSPYIPLMAVAGNHEGESQYLYSYLRLDDQSAYPQNPSLNEKIWSLRVANSLFIGLNTNIIAQYGTTELNWLDSKLNEAEQDATIDFVFLFFHHPPYSELWFDVSTFDGGANYVKDKIFPVIEKYTKVQQINTGHTHGFERGTIMSAKADGDFRIICGGGGGGPLDRWGAFTNFDYPDIHIALDHYNFQILEIDTENHSYENSLYSLGNSDKPRNIERLDSWYKKLSQPGPDTPVALNSVLAGSNYILSSSKFMGQDSLMSVELQVIDSSENSWVVIDSLFHWTDIYGVDKSFNPIDKNIGINLYALSIPSSSLTGIIAAYFRVRYRDHNLKWSQWSDPLPVNSTTANRSNISALKDSLYQNFPNPFSNLTRILYSLDGTTDVNFQFYDSNWRMIKSINEGKLNHGMHYLDFSDEGIESGIYFYKMITNNSTSVRKMVKMF